MECTSGFLMDKEWLQTLYIWMLNRNLGKPLVYQVGGISPHGDAWSRVREKYCESFHVYWVCEYKSVRGLGYVI